MVDQSINYTGPELDAPVAIDEMGPPPNSNYLPWIRLASIVIVLVGWELIGRQINPLFMSYPTAIITSAVRVISTGELIFALFESLRTLLVGFFVSSAFGIALGLSIGRYKSVEAATD